MDEGTSRETRWDASVVLLGDGDSVFSSNFVVDGGADHKEVASILLLFRNVWGVKKKLRHMAASYILQTAVLRYCLEDFAILCDA
jgi:hypothetical protein